MWVAHFSTIWTYLNINMATEDKVYHFWAEFMNRCCCSSECYRTWTNIKHHIVPLRCCIVSFHWRHVQDVPSLQLIHLPSFPFGDFVQGFGGSVAPDNISANPRRFLFTISAARSEKQWSVVFHMWDLRWVHSRLCRYNKLCMCVFNKFYISFI